MGEFKLDTSGEVQDKRTQWVRFWKWSDLSPFAQGYTEALLLEAAKRGDNHVREDGVEGRAASFSDVAPETLARIIEDCERFGEFPTGEHGMSESGISFWQARQWGYLRHDRFPALSVSLGDDGKIYLSNASQSEGVQL